MFRSCFPGVTFEAYRLRVVRVPSTEHHPQKGAANAGAGDQPPAPGGSTSRAFTVGLPTAARRRGRLVRNLLTALVFLGVITSSVWGEDDHFPFAPFRMYSTTTSPSGTVTMPHFEAVTVSGARLELETEDLGLRSAEVLGLMDRFRREPALLRRLAQTHGATGPARSRLAELSLVQGIHSLRDGRPDGYSEEIVSVWRER